MTTVTAVIPAAGLGTRLLPNSFACPKELVAIYRKPAIQWVLEEVFAAGVERAVLVTSAEKPAIRRYFEGSEALEEQLRAAGKTQAAEELRHVRALGDRISYVLQDEPRGLGHAVLVAEPEVAQDVLVANPDDLWLRAAQATTRLLARQKESGQSVIATQDVRREEISQYGCVDPEGAIVDGCVLVRDVVEKPTPSDAPSTLAVSGRWLLKREVFDVLRDVQPGRGAEIQLSDALRVLAQGGQLCAEVFPAGLFYDVGNPSGVVDASVAFREVDSR